MHERKYNPFQPRGVDVQNDTQNDTLICEQIVRQMMWYHIYGGPQSLGFEHEMERVPALASSQIMTNQSQKKKRT